LANRVVKPSATSGHEYPSSINTQAKRAFYDNFGKDEALSEKIDKAVNHSRTADFVGDRMKERAIEIAIREETKGYELDVKEVMEIVKRQSDYQ